MPPLAFRILYVKPSEANPNDVRRRQQPYSVVDHLELLIACQRAAGRGHRHETGRRSARNCGLQVGIGNHHIGCGGPVEENGSGAGESLAQNATGPPNPTRVALQTHERTESNRQAEDRAVVVEAAFICCPVETPVRALDQPSVRVGPVGRVETMQGRKHASRGDCVFELTPTSNGIWTEKVLHSFKGEDVASQACQ